jgi:hypothetical protein
MHDAELVVEFSGLVEWKGRGMGRKLAALVPCFARRNGLVRTLALPFVVPGGEIAWVVTNWGAWKMMPETDGTDLTERWFNAAGEF